MQVCTRPLDARVNRAPLSWHSGHRAPVVQISAAPEPESHSVDLAECFLASRRSEATHHTANPRPSGSPATNNPASTGEGSLRHAVITISTTTAALSDLDVDALVVGVFKGGIEGPGTSEALSLLNLEDFPVTPAFRGDVGQTLRLSAPDQSFGSLLLVGLGRMDAISPAALRLAAGEAVRAVPKAARIATTLAEVNPTRAAIEAVADGLVLGRPSR